MSIIDIPFLHIHDCLPYELSYKIVGAVFARPTIILQITMLLFVKGED